MQYYLTVERAFHRVKSIFHLQMLKKNVFHRINSVIYR